MQPQDAFQLDNWIPRGSYCETRGGSEDYATGVPGAVESLEVYTGGAGSKMLAFGNGSIYDVSLGGAVGSALASGKTSNKVTTAMFANAGSQFLLIYTGADQPMSYNGTAIANLTITGMTGSQNTLHSPMAFKGRMYLAQEDQLGFYYLAVGAIQGAASFFDLQQQSLRGGALATMVSYSQESMGDGPQDYALFVTTEGEYIMYAGTDPSNAATWELVGRYYGPPPIGKKGWFKFRSDVYFITREGILSFTQIRQMGEEASDTKYLTSRLGQLYAGATTYKNTHGWTGIIYPAGSLLVVNIPRSGAMSGAYTQFVMDTNSNAWGQFTNWNGICFALFNDRLYFGTNAGKVVLADEGFTDNGAEVVGVARPAWNDFDNGFGLGNAEKQFHMLYLAVRADGVPSVSCALNVNFENDEPVSASAAAPPEGVEWDVPDWDTADWADGPAIQNIAIPVSKLGYVASPWLKAVSTASTIQWYAYRSVFQKTKGVFIQ
jgi:hypothetical protein